MYGILGRAKRIEKTAEFIAWYDILSLKEQAQVESRLHRIEHYGHFGDLRDLGDGLAELRWANGRRVYFTRVIDENGHVILLVLGGLKNGQKKDIKKARLLIQRHSGAQA